MANKIEVRSIDEAWAKVNEVFPTDYEKDEESSQRAGYPIYRSTAEGHYEDYICDLNTRLEVNIAEGNQTINVWIELEEQGADIEVTVIAKIGETRVYSTYDEYRKDFRFFWSSGKTDETKDGAEAHFEKII